MKLRFTAKKLKIQLLLAVYLLSSYNYIPWPGSALTGFMLILAIAWWIWKTDFNHRIGIPLRISTILLSFALAALFFAGSWWIMNSIALHQNIEIRYKSVNNFLHIIFYTLNEEIVLGALLLNWIRVNLKRTPLWIISITVALAFSLIHFVFFRWIFDNKGDLSLLTLGSLWMVGIIRNNLIMGTGHIGFSWAIHAGWVGIMFGFVHFNQEIKKFMTDLERFNFYLGNIRIADILILIAAISFLFLFFNRKKKEL